MAKKKKKAMKTKKKKGKKGGKHDQQPGFIMDDNHVRTNSNTQTTCPTPLDKQPASVTVQIGCEKSGVTGRCYRGYFYWDVSTIPVNSIVTNILFECRVMQATSARDCRIIDFDIDPQISDATTVWSHLTQKINNGDILQTTGDLRTLGPKDIVMSSLACQDLTGKLSNRVWAFGIVDAVETRCPTTNHIIKIASKENGNVPAVDRPRLTVTFNPP